MKVVVVLLMATLLIAAEAAGEKEHCARNTEQWPAQHCAGPRLQPTDV